MSDNEDKPPLMSAGLQIFLWHRLVEVSGLVICALSLGLLVILLTANPADPSLNTASAREVQNWFGPSGANLANLLYQAVGLSALGFGLARVAIKRRGDNSEVYPAAQQDGDDLLPPGETELVFDGALYTSVFNPMDGRKNWRLPLPVR